MLADLTKHLTAHAEEGHAAPVLLILFQYHRLESEVNHEIQV